MLRGDVRQSFARLRNSRGVRLDPQVDRLDSESDRAQLRPPFRAISVSLLACLRAGRIRRDCADTSLLLPGAGGSGPGVVLAQSAGLLAGEVPGVPGRLSALGLELQRLHVTVRG